MPLHRIKLLKSCVDEEGGLIREEELAVVEVMCVVAERIKTVRFSAFSCHSKAN
jgi:hypothetical protein